MADTPQDRPSLEMPSFSRRRRQGRATEPEQEPDGPIDAATTTVAAGPPADPGPAPGRRAPRVTLPSLAGPTAAGVTGLVVGALAVLLTWLSTTACDAVRGTSSCGGGPGFLLLLAVLVVLAYAGALLMRAFGVTDAASTSVLAVGITAVLVMLFLLDSIYDGWMVVAIPVVAVVAYVGSWWITQAVVEDD